MKRFSMILIFAISIICSYGQPKELILRGTPNNDAKLIHYCTFINNDSSSDKLAKQIQEQLDKSGLDIRYTNNIDTLADVVLDNKKFKNAKKTFSFLKEKFYTGRRPVVSTVFESKVDGYPEFRIPSVITLGDGYVMAFIEAREFEHSDQAQNNIVVKISEDYGKTWGKTILVDDQGDVSLNNPCSVYIPTTGEVIVMYQSYPPRTKEGRTVAGFDGKCIVRNWVSRSSDKGKTWSKPENITSTTKYPDALTFCSGPGIAVIGKNGRIVVPFNADGPERWYNYFVVSDDNGKTWKIADGKSQYGTNESQTIWIEDNKYLVNARCHRYIGDNGDKTPVNWSAWNFDKVTRRRANILVEISEDGNSAKWHPTQVMENQPDPLCQGSIIKLHGVKNKPVILSNPKNDRTHYTATSTRPFERIPPIRLNGTVKISYDNGATWVSEKRIHGNPFTQYQYSVLTDLGNGLVGCFFEASGVNKFATFDIDWLLK